jgi:anti-sigma B factor antagonist
MLNATAQKLGDSTVLRCQGRIVIGDAYAILRNAVLGQTHTQTLILDLAQVDRIDAGGLGVLLGLREWAYSQAIRFQLMNVMNHVEHVLELTKLDCVFEFCSVEDVLHLLHSTAAIAPPVGRSSEPENHERQPQVFSRRARCSSSRTEKQSSCWNCCSRPRVGGISSQRAVGTNWRTDL